MIPSTEANTADVSWAFGSKKGKGKKFFLKGIFYCCCFQDQSKSFWGKMWKMEEKSTSAFLTEHLSKAGRDLRSHLVQLPYFTDEKTEAYKGKVQVQNKKVVKRRAGMISKVSSSSIYKSTRRMLWKYSCSKIFSASLLHCLQFLPLAIHSFRLNIVFFQCSL